MSENRYYATGKRKSSVARCWLIPGNGTITVNRKAVDIYFARETDTMVLRQPLTLTSTQDQLPNQVLWKF